MNMTFSSIFAGLALCVGLSTSAMGQELKVDPKLKVSKVAYAGMQAAFDFAHAFEKVHGHLPEKEFVGFQMATNADGQHYDAGIYHIAGEGKLATDLYNCHFHMENGDIESAHCHDEKEQDVKEYVAAPRKFSLAEFQTGLIEMLEYFKGEHGEPSNIRDLKMWHGKGNLEFRVTYIHGDHDHKEYIMCHYHGDHMDCHGRNRPGKHEPVDFFYN